MLKQPTQYACSDDRKGSSNKKH